MANYIFYYSENDEDHHRLSKSLMLAEHNIQLANVREIDMPRDISKCFLMGKELVDSLLPLINGKIIFIGDSLSSIKAGKVSREQVNHQIREFFGLQVFEKIKDIDQVIAKFEEAGVKFKIPASSKDLIVPDDISFEELRSFLYMCKYLGFYNIEFSNA